MNAHEAHAYYGIPVSILSLYESWGLCEDVKKVMGAWQYDDTDLERLSMIMTLHDIGFDNVEIEAYMRLMLMDGDTVTERLRMISRKRSIALDEIHLREARIGRLDYLRHEIRKANKHKRHDDDRQKEK